MKKRRNASATEEKNAHLDRLCEDLGADTIKKLHKAFTLTAAAIYRRASQQAKAKLQQAEEDRRGSQ